VSAVFLQRDIERITAECIDANGGNTLVRGRYREREKKRVKIQKVADRFFKIMQGPNPPKTEAEAIATMLPFWVPLLLFVGKELARQVILWLWHRTQE
jgi:hypothetical protein